MKQGIQRGLQKGRQQQAVSVLRQLTRRLGAVPVFAKAFE